MHCIVLRIMFLLDDASLFSYTRLQPTASGGRRRQNVALQAIIKSNGRGVQLPQSADDARGREARQVRADGATVSLGGVS